MIRNTQKDLSLHIDIAVADMGYISSDQKMELRKQSHTAVLTRVRENMSPPREYFDRGCPECPEGIPLRILGYLSDTCQVLLLFADMKTNTKAKAKRAMKKLYTQLTFDF